jgi:DNA-directed RNA polymerase beta' subunit
MTDLAKELNNLQPTRRVGSVQFGIMDSEVIRKGSVCEITKAETYDGSEPVTNGLFDPRMGVIDRGPKCATCENTSELCPGHFGHIELAWPVYHMQFITTVLKLLHCVCFRCSKLLVSKTNKKLLKNIKDRVGENRFQIIYDACTKTQKSPRCCSNKGCRIIQPTKYEALTADKLRGQKIPGIEKDTVIAIVSVFKEEAIKDISTSNKHRITPQQAYEIFRKITKEDCEFLGFTTEYTRPEWMICSALYVAPPAVRPSVQRENNQRSEDDLTYVYHMIIKANNALKTKIEKGEEQQKIDSAYNLLQYNVATLISNKIPGFLRNVQRSGKPIKAIRERLTGKDARVRGNLMGKRVNFSGRTVISVDPGISIDEFGMPKKMAMTLTYPEKVTPENFEEMSQIVRNGPKIHPGAKKIEREEFDCYGTPSPCMINLNHIDPNTIELKIGDKVHRHIKDGDICLFNRQPSLHKMNMMAHKARIVENNTFRLNVSVCLAGDTIINTNKGSVTLEGLKDYWKNNTISSVDWKEEKNVYECGISKYHKIVPDEHNFKSYRIVLENGTIMRATQEHPFYTKRGDRILAKDLNVGDYLVGYNETLPEIENNIGETILQKELVEEHKFFNKDSLEILKSYKLLDIDCNSEKQIILAGLFGSLLADGTLWNKGDTPGIVFRTSQECDIKSIRKDLIKIGISPDKVNIRKHKDCVNRKITTSDGKEVCFNGKGLYEIYLQRAIAFAFTVLGAPFGDRVKQEFNVPSWIMNGSKMVKRQFLRGYLGGDASSPTIDKRTGYRFRTIHFKMSKLNTIKTNKFFEDIYQLLNEFGIETTSVKIEKGNKRKDGISHVFKGSLRGDIVNSRNFFEKIGYIYCDDKHKKAMIASEFCKYIVGKKTKGKYNKPDKFDIWRAKYQIFDTSLVWCRIKEIEEIELDYAYDITTKDENHNFISHHILTKNCAPYNKAVL